MRLRFLVVLFSLLLLAVPAASYWTLDSRHQQERMITSAMVYLSKNWTRYPAKVNGKPIIIEIGPTKDTLDRIFDHATLEELNFYAITTFEQHRFVITLMEDSFKYDWLLRDVLVHELTHVRLDQEGYIPMNRCMEIRHEVLALREEMSSYKMNGVPEDGEGRHFRERNAEILMDYYVEYHRNFCVTKTGILD